MKGGAARAGLSKSLKRSKAVRERNTRKRRHAKGDKRRAHQTRIALAYLSTLPTRKREEYRERLEAQIEDMRQQADELEAAAETARGLAEARARADRHADGDFSNSDDSNESNDS